MAKPGEPQVDPLPLERTPGAAPLAEGASPARTAPAGAAARAAAADSHRAAESQKASAAAEAADATADTPASALSASGATPNAGGSGAAANPAGSSTSLPGTSPMGGPGAVTPAGLSPAGSPAAPADPGAAAHAPAFTLSPSVHSAAFPGALGVQLSVLAKNGIEQARMVVNPEQMGPIAVQLALDGTQVRVDFVADNSQTRQLLQDALPGLAGAMREAGFTLAGGGVFQQARDGRQAPPGANPGDGASRRADATLAAVPAEGDLGLQAARARRVRVTGLVDTFA